MDGRELTVTYCNTLEDDLTGLVPSTVDFARVGKTVALADCWLIRFTLCTFTDRTLKS